MTSKQAWVLGLALLVGTCATEARTRRLLAAVADATDVPLHYAVNTQDHSDHAYGNCLLPAPTVLIAHEATREAQLVDPLI